MKNYNNTSILLLLLGSLLCQAAFLTAQTTITNETCIKKVKMGADALIIELKENYEYATLEIVGADYFYLKKEFNDSQALVIESSGLEGQTFKDGRYKMRITPMFKLSKADEKVLRDLSTLNELALLEATKESLQIPLDVQPNALWEECIALAIETISNAY